MIDMSLSDVRKIYDCSNRVKITYHPVEQSNFEDFCVALKNFKRLLNEAAEDDYWRNFLYPLRRYQFELSAAPLPFNTTSASDYINLANLQKQLSRLEVSYPDLFLPATGLLSQLYILSNSSSNPLLSIYSSIYKSNKQRKIVLLLKESRLIPPVEKLISQINLLNTVKVIVASQLRSLVCYDKVILIGSPYWFPKYVLTAPRTSEIDIVYYRWIRSKWKDEPVFIGSVNSSQSPINTEIKNTVKEVQPKIDSEIIAAKLEPKDVLMPTIDWSDISQKISQLHSVNSDREEIEAKLFLLEGSTSAVFLDREAKTFVIDLQEEVSSRVQRISVADIEADMFILLRTSGGGDYIVPVANRILKNSGKDVEKIRNLQQEWKGRLKLAVKRQGLHSVSQNLVKQGSKIAKNELNIRNWTSELSIKPRKEKDFEAILNFVGLGDRCNEFYEAAYWLDTSHRSAGKHIRKLLLQEVCNADLTQLEQLGSMEFELEQADGGSMTAFRVVDIAPEIHNISISKIAQIFEI
ncbi:MAG: hypothetical protein RIE73_27695 [Coleofasciculus sp. C1-SOL-03]